MVYSCSYDPYIRGYGILADPSVQDKEIKEREKEHGKETICAKIGKGDRNTVHVAITENEKSPGQI